MLIITEKNTFLLVFATIIFMLSLFSINHGMVVALSYSFGLNSTVPLRDHLILGFATNSRAKTNEILFFTAQKSLRF